MKLQVVIALGLLVAAVTCAPENPQPKKDDDTNQEGCEEGETLSGKGAEAEDAMEKASGAFQGDMMDFAAGKEAGSNRNAVKDASRKWPKSSDGNVYVPYQLNSDIQASTAHRNAISAAINSYADKTCIKFFPRTNQKAYLDVKLLDGCYSQVGKSPDYRQPQTVSLGWGCQWKSTVEHEFMHALGFLHEQSRPDRDEYITILKNNIKSGMEHNFDKGSPDQYTTQNLAYDPKSIMQYRETSFGIIKNGVEQVTMQINKAKFPGQDVTHLGASRGPNGESADFTTLDVKKLNKLYNCDNSNPDAIGAEDIKTGYLSKLDLQFSQSDIKTFIDNVNSLRRSKGKQAIQYNNDVAKKIDSSLESCNAQSFLNCGSTYRYRSFGQDARASTVLNRFFDGVKSSTWLTDDFSAMACGYAPCGVAGSAGGVSIENYIVCSKLYSCAGGACSGRRSDIDPQNYCRSLSFLKGRSFTTDACESSYYPKNGFKYYPNTCCKTWGTC